MALSTEPRDDPAALASAILEEEGRRQAEQDAKAPASVVLPDDLLPGVGGEPMALRDVVRRGGFATITVLTMLNLVDEFDRVAMTILGPDIQRSLGMSDTVLGFINGIGALIIVVGSVPFGIMADRMRRTWLISGSTVVWAFFALITGAVRNAWELAFTRVFSGLGKGNSPVASSILSDAYPIEGRSRVFALYNMANPIGILIAPVLAGGITSLAGGDEGWRWAFVVLAAPAAVLTLFTLALREPKRGRNEQMAVLGEELDDDKAAPIAVGTAMARLKKIKTFYFLSAGLGALGFGLFGVATFSSLYLDRRYGLSPFERGTVGSIGQLGAFVGVILGGMYGDRIFRRSPSKAVLLMALGIGGFGLMLSAGFAAPNLPLYVAFHMVANCFLWIAFVPSTTLVAAITPYRLRAMGFALVAIYLFLVGASFGGLITGALSDTYGPRAAVLIVMPPSALLGAALVAYTSRYVRRDISLVVEELKEEQDERRRIAESGADAPVLQVRNLDFSYGQVQVLFDVALEVQRGEVLALLGTNGAGKSTLLKAVSGLVVPDRGVVRLNGRTVTYSDAETRVALGIVQVPGGAAVFPSLTVRENLLAGAHQFISDRERVDRRTDYVIGLFPVLGERLDQPAGTLSGGEQQMLGLAKALLLEPEILLIDELSLGLAPVVVQHLLEVVEQLKAEGLTMIIVEQSVNVALSVADRAVFMEKGQVKFTGPAHELLERDDLVRAVFLGGEGG